jgi:hypothetical protein
MAEPAQATSPSPHDGHALAVALAPTLIQQTGGRLSGFEWFRSTWQHGGAATGFAQWTADDGRHTPVLVKLPVGPVEYRWTTQLGSPHPGENGRWNHYPTPRVLASGQALGGYDLAWIVVERLESSLSHGWCQDHLDALIRAVALMQHRAAAACPVPAQAPPGPHFADLIARSRQIAHDSALPEAQHWNEAVKKVQKALPRLIARWAARPIDSWCHGDVHPGNAMRRPPEPPHPAARPVPNPGPKPVHPGSPPSPPPPPAPCVLIDLALVHAGCWVEDAVYLERQFWGRPDQLFGIHPVSLLAKYRRELGLRTDGDYGTLANLRRVLMASIAPLYFAHEGHPRYLHGALETLDRLLPQVIHLA